MSTSILPSTDRTPRQAATPLTRLCRRLLLSKLAGLQHGQLHVADEHGEQVFGQLDERCALSARIQVLSPRFYPSAVFGGTVGAGESYINGEWLADDLTAVVRILLANFTVVESLGHGWGRVGQPFLRLFHWLNRNTRGGSARNIAAHYDLGNEFYRLMLDETMAYSCGIYTSDDCTLAQASRAKFAAACRKLDLRPGDRLLEIGTGWGGLAIYAAQHHGCHVTTTTISREQHDYTRERIAALGLGDRITLLFEDYRDLKGRYDKLVSVEMIEAVGARFLDTYLAKCSALLEHHGAMLLQAITVRDQGYWRRLGEIDFIQRFVFPGSFIPCVQAITDSLQRVTNLKLFHLEDIGPHYARTLAEWRDNFSAHLPQVRALGFDDAFVRLWNFYLCYCEGGFAERYLGDVQMLLTKPGCRRPALASL